MSEEEKQVSSENNEQEVQFQHIKNKLFVDLDTEREQPIIFGKDDENLVPKDKEDEKKMILLDISTLCDGLITLIHIAHLNGYVNKNHITQSCIEQLQLFLSDSLTPEENSSE